MDIFFQTLGSIASISSIPIVIFIYLRNREAKYIKLRHEIVRTLSYQIGEGRYLKAFIIQAVINNKLYEYKKKPNSITIDEIVEDLVVETVQSPMLDSQRKEQILTNLQQLHQRGNILSVIDKYSISYKTFIQSIQNLIELSPEDSILFKREINIEPEEVEVKISHKPASLSTIFAKAATIIAVIALIVTGIFAENVFNTIQSILQIHRYQISLIIGGGVSLLAGIITGIMTHKIQKTYLKKEKQAKKE